MNFCKDCRYYQRLEGDLDRCLHPECDEMDVVLGERYAKTCSSVRIWGPCGKEGTLFEPKLSAVA